MTHATDKHGSRAATLVIIRHGHEEDNDPEEAAIDAEITQAAQNIARLMQRRGIRQLTLEQDGPVVGCQYWRYEKARAASGRRAGVA